MKFAVVDDDKEFLNYFYTLMLPYIKNNEVDFYSSPTSFLRNVYEKGQIYDAIFLDIDMPSINGIELSKKIYENNRNCLIVFITNKKEMVYDAFGVNVLSFVYKPDFEYKIKETFNALYTVLDYDKTVIISSSDGKKKIRIKDIFYIKRDLRKIVLCINGKEKFLTNYRNLADLDKIVQHPSIVYINRSVRINLQHANQILNDIIYLNNSEHFDISKAKTKEITELFVKTNFNTLD